MWIIDVILALPAELLAVLWNAVRYFRESETTQPMKADKPTPESRSGPRHDS